MPTLAVETLLAFSRALFAAAGVPTEEAAVVSGSLVDASLCGHDSHGLIRVVQYLRNIEEGRIRPGAAFQVVHETPAVVVVDAHWGFGQVQSHRLLQKLFPKARQVGVAAGTLRQCAHIGRLGEYAEAAAAEGLAFVGTVNGHGWGRNVAPPGGTAARIGTNPLCIGAPSRGDPLVLDIGTSVCAEGKVRVAFNKGQPVPAGWLLDPEGRPTTDAGTLYREPRGSILPLGGAQAYKGFGLGLLLEAFAGGFSGSPCSNAAAASPAGNAVFFAVFDPKHFAGSDHFLGEVTDLSAYVRSSPPAQGIAEILLPGDPERRERTRRRAAGVPVDDGTWAQLTAAAEGLKVAVPQPAA